MHTFHWIILAMVMLVVVGRVVKRRVAREQGRSLDDRAQSAPINREVAKTLRARFDSVGLRTEDSAHVDDPESVSRHLQVTVEEAEALDTTVKAIQREILKGLNQYGAGCKHVEIEVRLPPELQERFDDAYKELIRDHKRVKDARKMGCEFVLVCQPPD